MKTKIFLSLLVLAALCFVPSCSDDDDVVENANQQTDNPNQNTGDGNTGDENTPDDGTYDEDSPLENGLIVIEDGTTFTGYSEEPWYSTNREPMFPEETQQEATTLGAGLVGTHNGYTLAYLRSGAADYLRVDSPNTLTISEGSNGYTMSLNVYRWGLSVDSAKWWGSDEPQKMKITTNPDASVYTLDTQTSSEDEGSHITATMPNWGDGQYNHKFDNLTVEDVTQNFYTLEFDGKIASDASKYEFYCDVKSVASGTLFIFRSGSPTPAEAMSGHYYGTLTFDNQWLSTVTTYQGTNTRTVGDPTGGAGKGDMYALINSDPDGDIRFDITGFDIGKNVFGNLTITGIKDVTDHENWGYDFELDDFEVEQPINDVWATVTGSLEGEMTFDGKLTVIIKAKYPVIGDVTLTYESEYTDWLGWNTYYGAQSRRPW